MSTQRSPLRRKRGRSYYVGATAFFALLFGLSAALYFATIKVDYVWRWNRIPQYFFYKAQLDIRFGMENIVGNDHRNYRLRDIVECLAGQARQQTSEARRAPEGAYAYSDHGIY